MSNIRFDKKFFSLISEISVNAGKKIIVEYNKKKQFRYKEDGSPVTIADKKADHFIAKSLIEYNPEIPILSEESSPDTNFLDSNIFWAVDPLDGTKEFLANSPDFTVNIALIKNKYPIFGVVYAPVYDVLWVGYHDRYDNNYSRSYKLKQASKEIRNASSKWTRISVDKKPRTIKVMTSKSHGSNKLASWISKHYKNKDIEVTEMGSSLKICFIADGGAHLYPRFGRTCIWDTAAGHAIVNSSGGSVTVMGTNSELQYTKSIYNSEFLVANKSYY